MIRPDTIVLILDLVGTFVFAISGAAAAVNRRLDIFGILVLSFVAALAGAGVVVLGDMFHVSYRISALVGTALCFGLRIMAIRYGWHLPAARLSAQRRAETSAADDER